MDTASACYETDAGFRQAHFGVVGCDDDIASHCQLKASTERVAVDCGYDGLPAFEV